VTSHLLSHPRLALLIGETAIKSPRGRLVTPRFPVPPKWAHPPGTTEESAPRPARDIPLAHALRATRCSAFSTSLRSSHPSFRRLAISSAIAPLTSAGRLSRGGSGPARRLLRDFRLRLRAASREANGATWYRSRASRARLFSRHSVPHVL
jgi:hypothetical protein